MLKGKGKAKSVRFQVFNGRKSVDKIWIRRGDGIKGSSGGSFFKLLRVVLGKNLEKKLEKCNVPFRNIAVRSGKLKKLGRKF